ncbi:MAG: hypothetical protein Q8R28_11890 [Dehalococcoidia bacterium]|nr:hypothetical protein [Dehalococcoidia bacterium]
MAANGFVWRYNLSGGRPLILDFIAQDTETFHAGDMINIESGLADLAATGGDSGLAGVFVGPTLPSAAKDGQPGVVEAVTAVTLLKVIVNPDAVYGVFDENARLAGAALDITGTTGAQTVGASGDNDVVVVERKRQSADETRVMLDQAVHYLTKAH